MATIDTLSKDFLTGFYNREGIYPVIQKLQKDYEQYHTPFSVLLIDIDHFKMFNDKYGHASGDKILKFVSNAIYLNLVAEPTYPFRLGGDEFLVLFPAKSSEEVERLADRMRKDIGRMSYEIDGRSVTVSFSAGISSYPANGHTEGDLLEKADKAMYYCKKHGRGRVARYDNMSAEKIKLVGKSVRILCYLSLLAVLVALGVRARLSLDTKFLSAVSEIKLLAAHLRDEMAHTVDHLKFKARSLAEPSPEEPQVSPKQSVIEKPDELLDTRVVPQVPQMPQASQAHQEVSLDTIYLKSGGVIRGAIVEEDKTQLKLEPHISVGHGTIVLKKANISKIVRGEGLEKSQMSGD